VRLPDWRNAAEYPSPRTLPNYRWAWEFLRRNPDYRKDWADVLARYLANPGDYFGPDETRYPEPIPAEDGWNPDPNHHNFFMPADESAKWSLRDMVNPATDDPGFLAFTLQFGYLYTFHRDGPKEPKGAQYPWAFFNLNLSLKPQLETLRRMLAAEQKRQGIKPHRVTHHRDLWPDYLRLLDADLDGRTPKQIADALQEQIYGLDDRKVGDRLKAARKMMEPEGYLSIFLSTPPENSAPE
jgi:hypothetical protein